MYIDWADCTLAAIAANPDCMDGTACEMHAPVVAARGPCRDCCDSRALAIDCLIGNSSFTSLSCRLGRCPCRCSSDCCCCCCDDCCRCCCCCCSCGGCCCDCCRCCCDFCCNSNRCICCERIWDSESTAGNGNCCLELVGVAAPDVGDCSESTCAHISCFQGGFGVGFASCVNGEIVMLEKEARVVAFPAMPRMPPLLTLPALPRFPPLPTLPPLFTFPILPKPEKLPSMPPVP